MRSRAKTAADGHSGAPVGIFSVGACTIVANCLENGLQFHLLGDSTAVFPMMPQGFSFDANFAPTTRNGENVKRRISLSCHCVGGKHVGRGKKKKMYREIVSSRRRNSVEFQIHAPFASNITVEISSKFVSCERGGDEILPPRLLHPP